MAYFRDVREHLAALDEAGLLQRVDQPVDKDLEMHPLVRLQFRGLPESQRKAFLFTRAVDRWGRTFKSSVAVACLAGSRAIYAYGLQCAPDEISARWAQALAHPLAPTLCASGPVQEVVHEGLSLLQPGGGLEELPIPISTPGFDAGPYVSAAHWVTYDPETRVRNVGNYRGLVKARTRLGMNAGWSQHISEHWRKWRAIGKPMPAAVVVGAPPNVSYASVIKVPAGVDEYAVAGGLAGEALPVVRAKTIDVEVPAYAEIVIEGFINTELMEPEGPFGEFTGYMDPQQLNPFLDVTCITHRNNPVLVTMLSQFPPSESSMIRAVGSEARVLAYLHDRGFACVKQVAYLECTGSWGCCCIQVSDPAPSEAAAILAACDVAPLKNGKMIVLVDDDVDPRDTESVLWAMSYRMQPHRDVQIRPATLLSSDWSAFPPDSGNPGGVQAEEQTIQATLLLVDATRKWGYPPLSLPPSDIMERAVELWTELGLAPLKLQTPWHGADLGWWTEEDRDAGRLAMEGRYFETGERMAQGRVSAGNVQPGGH